MPKTNPILDEITELFTLHMGMKPTPQKQQRYYANHILKTFGDKTLDLVRFAISIQEDYYAPRITSPKDLYYKSSRVLDYYKKNSEGNGVLR